jgi:hypothetical protein
MGNRQQSKVNYVVNVMGTNVTLDFFKQLCVCVYVCVCVCVCVCGNGVWAQSFMLTRQALYCLSASHTFCSGYLEIGSHFLPRLAWTIVLLFYASHTIAEMTGVHNHFQLFFFYWYGVLWTLLGFFSPGWPQPIILLISVSQEARITA